VSKRLVIIPLSGVRGASIRRRRPRCTLRTALCYIFPPKYVINILITTASPRSFENISIFKILYFENFLPPFLGLWGLLPLISNLLWSSPDSTLPFPPSSPLRLPEKIPTKKSKAQDVLYLPYYYLPWLLNPRNPLTRRLGGRQTIMNAGREEDIPFSSLGIELQFLCRPARSLLLLYK